MLDRGWGACWLQRNEIARIVQDAILLFDGERNRLHAWTIMPNHVHVLISGLVGVTLGSPPLGAPDPRAADDVGAVDGAAALAGDEPPEAQALATTTTSTRSATRERGCGDDT